MYRLGFACCLALWLSGCLVFADDDDDRVVSGPTGTLLIEWTIDDATNPAECVQSSVSSIDIAIEKQTHITVTGVDRQLVGQVAANIRRLREPDPYKQKGVRYTGEVLKKKAGKTGAKA